jgi:hypothetical protein
MLSFLTKPLAGVIASATAAALALALTFVWASGKAAEHALKARIAVLERSIDDPKTGWRARLGQCRDNGAALQASIDDQNGRIEAWKQAAADAQRRAAAETATARIATTQAQKSAATILTAQPRGDRCGSALDLIRRRR